MKAAVVENNNIRIKDLDKPVLGAQKGAIIKVLGCGLCGSDIVKLRQQSKDGTVLGHEIVGEIVEINSDTNFKTGDRIVMGHHVPCFECVYCKGGNYSMCRQFKETNIIPGGFCEYLFASEAHLKNTVFKIPSDMDDVTASFLEPLGCCVRAIKRAFPEMENGKWKMENEEKNNYPLSIIHYPLNHSSLLTPHSSLVIGLGSIGLLMGQAIKAYGQRVIGCDLLKERVDFAEKLGFDAAFVSDDTEKTVAEIKKLTENRGIDAVFMTSGAYQTIPFALSSVRDGGKIIVFSSVHDAYGYSNNDIYYRELSVIGSYSPAPEDLADSLSLLRSKKVIVKDFSSVYNFNQINSAVDDTVQNKILKAYIKV